MSWFARRGGKRGGAAAGGGCAASSSSAAAASSSDAGASKELTIEEEFAVWYDSSWPGQATVTGAVAATAGAAAPARPPGTGTGAASECLKVFEQRRGEYYKCYGSDALAVADAFFKTRDVLKFIPLPFAARAAASASSIAAAAPPSARALPTLSLNPRKLLTILQAVVLGKGENLEIWRKGGPRGTDEDESMTDTGEDGAADDAGGDDDRAGGGGGRGRGSWFLLRRATPANVEELEELLGFTLSSGSSSVSVAIKIAASSPSGIAGGGSGGRQVALAFVDPQQRTAKLLEFYIDESDTSSTGAGAFSALEHALIAEGATQAFLLVPNTMNQAMEDDWIKVKRILAECRVPVQQAARGPRTSGGIGGGGGGGGKSKAAAATSSAASDDVQELHALSSGGGGSALTLADLQELSRFMSPSSSLSLDAPGLLQSRRHSLLSLQFLLLKALALTPGEDASSRLRLEELRLGEFVRVDQAAFGALMLFPRPGVGVGVGAGGASDEGVDSNMSLYGVLNKTRTGMGSRLLATFIRQPLTSRDRIVARQDYVELFFLHADLRSLLRDTYLRGVPDLGRLSSKLHKRRGASSSGSSTGAGLDDVMQFYKLGCVKLPQMREQLVEFIAGHQGYRSSVESSSGAQAVDPSSPLALPVLERLQVDFLTPLQTHLSALAPFANMIEQAVTVEESTSHGHARVRYMINPSIHPRLAEIAQARANSKSALDNEVESIISSVSSASGNAIQPKLAYSAVSRLFHLRLTKTEARKWSNGSGGGLSATAEGVKTLENRKDGLHFTTRRLEKLALAFQAVDDEYASASEQLLSDVIATSATYTPVMDALSSLLALLDVYTCLAHVAASAAEPWVRPSVLPLGSGKINILQARHACMELITSSANGRFIPNDIVMERGKSHLQIITGPNMGGKSSYIRTAGLNILMCQIGSFLPCGAGAEISVCDSILCRVGAGDSTSLGASTFMIEMLEAASILRAATPSSFVLIDELGRGTSVDEGFGIAYAIAEDLARNKRCFTMYATHFHEITALEQEVKGVVNKHVSVHESSTALTMLYSLADGPASRSYGIHVAELASFPPEIIAEAKRRAREWERFGTRGLDSAEQDGSEEQQPQEALSDEQRQLLDAFQRTFAAAEDTEDEAALTQRLAAFQAEHAALIRAADARAENLAGEHKEAAPMDLS